MNGKALAGDDSAWSGTAVTTQLDDSAVSQLADGGRMIWQRGKDPLKANVPMNFKFAVEDKDGQPAKDLESYMGMAGHAQFVSTDMSVFAHVHPAGSGSMAALGLARSGATSTSGALQAGMPASMPMPVPMSSAS